MSDGAYRAAFFNHPESRQSVEYGEWKTLDGLKSAIDRNFADGDANLVSIRKVTDDE